MKDNAQENLVGFMFDWCEHWPSVTKEGIRVVVGADQEDLDALKKDIEKLDEEWKGLVRF